MGVAKTPMGPTPIANHHTEERWVAMLGTHLRRQASTCQACLFACSAALSVTKLLVLCEVMPHGAQQDITTLRGGARAPPL